MAAIGTLPVVLGTGAHASRPAASAVGKGGLYSCTTHSLVYQTDGSSWTTWANLAGTGGSGTLATVEEADGSPTDAAVTKLVLPNGSLSIASHIATYYPPGLLLGYVYDTASGNVNITSTTLVDVDATNAITAAFAYPASGHIFCRITGSAGNTGDINCYVGVRDGSGILGSKVFATNPQGLKDEQFSCVVDITGLTPGGSHQLRVAAATNSGTFTIRSGTSAPVVMEVYAGA